MSKMNQQMIWDGQGPIYFGKYDPIKGTPEMGYLTNLIKIGCANSSFTTTPKVDYDTIKETCSGERLDLSQRVKSKSLTVSLTMQQFDSATFAKAFFSDALDVDAGTVTGEALPANISAGEFFFLKNPGSSNLVLTDSTSGMPVELVLDTHYKVIDAAQGMYQMINVSSLTLPITAAYSNAEHINVAAMTSTKLKTGILFTGKNQDGDAGRVVIPQINLALDGDFGWIADTAVALKMSGPALYCPELDTTGGLFGPYMQVKWIPNA